MGFNFHVGLPGPFSYSKRIGGGKPGPTATEQVAALAQRSRELDAADSAELFRTYGSRWLVLGGIALFLIIVIGGVIPTVAGVALIAGTAGAQVWRNRRMARRR